MNIIKPLSVQGKTPDYHGALPAATYELCGDKGVYMAVGFPMAYLVYRGTWDQKSNSGNWNWSYMKV